MVAAVEAAGVPNTVWYNYRRVPAVVAAQAADRRGEVRAHLPLPREVPAGLDDLRRTCRRAARACGGSTSKVAGSGVTGDLLAHCIDTALWLNGPITEVTAMTETFIKERKHNLTGKVEPVGIDDASAFLCRFENGSLATFEATRYARGHKALYTLEINGEHASARLGPARPAPHPVLRSPRRRPRARLAQRPRHRRRSPVHEALVGAGPADRLRAHVHSPVRGFRAGRRRGQERRRRRSATASRPTTSPTPCSSRRAPSGGKAGTRPMTRIFGSSTRHQGETSNVENRRRSRIGRRRGR